MVSDTIPSEVLLPVFEAKRNTAKPSQAYCGDDRNGKAVTAELIRDVAFDPADAGALRIARCAEPFAVLTAELAYGRGGPSRRSGSSGSGGSTKTLRRLEGAVGR